MRKTTLGHDLKDRNGKEMSLDHKPGKMTQGHEFRALNGKEMTLGHE